MVQVAKEAPISDLTTICLVLSTGDRLLTRRLLCWTSTLDQVRDAIYMPPRGRRRPGGRGLGWVQDYSYSTWKTEIEDDLIVLPQIETRKGLQHLEEIAAPEITTAMAIGPYDLSADLGVCGDTSGTEVNEAAQQIKRAAEAAGKRMWAIGDGPTLIKQGFTFLCIAEPTGLLAATMRDTVNQLKPAIATS